MDRTRKVGGVICHILILALVSLLVSSVAIAESSEREPSRRFASAGATSGTIEMPENAHAKSYRSGWDCDLGFREANGVCEAVMVPANAFPSKSSYGRGWDCSHGYLKTDEVCVAVKVPENAHLAASGNRWDCGRGYLKTDAACVAINLPANGYLSDSAYGPGWRCDRGYQTVNVACVAVIVPENAHLDYSGNDWGCNHPYRKKEERCVLL